MVWFDNVLVRWTISDRSKGNESARTKVVSVSVPEAVVRFRSWKDGANEQHEHNTNATPFETGVYDV